MLGFCDEFAGRRFRRDKMEIIADYHTHTTYSHGTGSVSDNALSAKEKGLKEIAISDHGFAHPFFGLKKSKLPFLKKDCESATEKTGVNVLVGIESNLLSEKGDLDLNEDLYEYFDVFLAGIHVCVKYKTAAALCKFGITSPIIYKNGGEPSEKLKAFTTKAYVNAIEKNPIDAITHLNYRAFANVKEIADCCRINGTYIEINTKKSHMTDEQWKEVYSTGVNFIIGSDAHSPDRVGDDKSAIELIDRLGFDRARVHNIDRLPDFRFKKYKG